MTAADILRTIGSSGKPLSGARAFLRTCAAFSRVRKHFGFQGSAGNRRSVRATLTSSLSQRS